MIRIIKPLFDICDLDNERQYVSIREEIMNIQGGKITEELPRNDNYQCDGKTEPKGELEAFGLVFVDPMKYGSDVKPMFDHASERLGIDIETGEPTVATD